MAVTALRYSSKSKIKRNRHFGIVNRREIHFQIPELNTGAYDGKVASFSDMATWLNNTQSAH